jgi:hypothetical protein
VTYDPKYYEKLYYSGQFKELLEYSAMQIRNVGPKRVADFSILASLGRAYSVNKRYEEALVAYCAAAQKFVFDIEEMLLLFDSEYPPIALIAFPRFEHHLSTPHIIDEDPEPFSFVVQNKMKAPLDRFPLPAEATDDGATIWIKFGEQNQGVFLNALKWCDDRNLETYSCCALFYSFTEYQSQFPVGRRVLRHIGMLTNILSDVSEAELLRQTRDLYIQHGCGFHGEWDQKTQNELIEEGLKYFYPVGRDNYLLQLGEQVQHA